MGVVLCTVDADQGPIAPFGGRSHVQLASLGQTKNDHFVSLSSCEYHSSFLEMLKKMSSAKTKIAKISHGRSIPNENVPSLSEVKDLHNLMCARKMSYKYRA